MQIRNAWILACCGIVVALPFVIGLLILQTGVDVPFGDEWEYAELIYRLHLGTLTFADLWTQHNEHRIFFPALISVTLARLGGWNPVREQLVSLVFLVVTQIGLLALIRRTTRGSLAWAASAIVSIFVYGLWQYENLGWGFELGWFVCGAATTTIVVLLTRRHRSRADVLISAIAAVVASFSLAQGLLAWGVGIVAMLLVPRRTIPTLCFWIPCAIVTYIVYQHGMSAVDNGGHIDAARHPLLLLHYACIYYGAPLFAWLGLKASTLAGALVLLGLVVAFASDLRRPHRLVHLVRRAPWYALAAYPVVTGIITASGRAGFGLDQALASRYMSVGGLLWISLVGIAATHCKRPLLTRSAAPLVGAFAIAAAVLGFAVFRADQAGWRAWSGTAANLAAAWQATEDGDRGAELRIYPVPERLEMLMNDLKSVRDGPFLDTPLHSSTSGT